MRFLAVIGLLVSVAVAAPDAAKLEQIKRQFPAHTAGPITDKTNPEIGLCFFTYKKMAAQIGARTLSSDFEEMRQSVIFELSREKYAPAESLGDAERANLNWLKTKVRPWLSQVEKLIVE